ncbi:CARDB domain-containing protein [Vulgatibacter sp.]|uniref:CARDB domain-containing protein n=1 Tax=Vulgatibacter sp. TaxID=1971226 RepID=UPI003565926F
MNRFFALSLCGAALLLPEVASAQQYVVSTSPSTYQALPIPGGGTVANVTTSSADDGAATAYALPFSFSFFGTTYNAINIGTNGYVTFGSENASSLGNQALPSTTSPNNLIAVWWDDQNCPAGSIQTQTLGQPGGREFVIQWHCYRHSTASNTWQAQLWLTEGSSVIRTKYGVLGSTVTSSTFTASMGIENAAASVGLQGYGPNGVTCGSSCTNANWPGGTTIQYGVSVEPDVLPVVALGAMTTTGSDVSFPVNTTVRNLGQNAATNLVYDVYLSTDAVLDPTTDTLLVQHVNGETVGGQSQATFSDSVTMPRPANGRYWVCVELDPANAIVESNEGNNRGCMATPFLVGADLLGSIAMPGQGAPGETVPFQIQVRNQGTDATGSFQYKIWMSANDSLDAYDTQIHTGTLSLQGTDTFSGTVNALVPGSIAGTTFYAFLQVDSGSVVVEADESNNTARTSGQITLVKPELSVNPGTVETANGCFFGEPMTVTYEVCNTGGGNAWNFVDSILFSDNFVVSMPNGGQGDPEVDTSPAACGSSDAECNAGGVCYLGICHNPCTSDAECGDGLVCAPDRDLPDFRSCQNHLAPGACKTFVRTFIVPGTNSVTGRPHEELEEGYWIGVIADSTDTVNEVNEANNIRKVQEPVVCRYPSPDLAAVTVVPPARVAAGETAALFRTVRNLGNVRGVASYRYVLSTNDTISLNDIPLTLVSTGGDGTLDLAGHSEQQATDLVRIPSHVAPGEYYLGLVIDANNAVRELDEKNNVSVASTRVRVENAALDILTTHLPDATVGAWYGRQLVATGGAGTYRWSIDTVPPGFTLTADGYLSGTPADEGTYVFTVSVTSGDASDSAMLALRVGRPMGALTITTTSLPPAVAGNPYSGRIAASGGEPPYTCRVLSGTLGSGLVLNADCTISGTPITATVDPHLFEVEVTDARGNKAQRDMSLVIVDQADLFIETQRLPEATAGEEYLDGCIKATGGDGDYTWTIEEASLPAGLAQENVGNRTCLIGTPLVCDSFSVSVRVEDGQGQADTAELPLTVMCGRVGLKTKRLDDVQRGDGVDVQLEADAGEAPTFRVYAGRLPAGIALDESGKLAGTVADDAAIGTYNFVVEVKDTEGGYGLDALALNVVGVPATLPPAKKADDGGCSTADDGATGALPFAVALLGLVAAGFRRRVAAGFRRRVAALARFAAFAAVLTVAGGAQAQNYVVTGPYDLPYQELVGATQAPSAYNDDDWCCSSDMWNVELPTDFSFRFFGATFSHIGISGNGALVPLTSASPGTATDFYVDTSNDDFPNTLGPNGVIAPWWEDLARSATLSPHAGGLSYVVEGTAPNRIFKVQWKNLTLYICSSSTSYNHCRDTRSHSFQAWIFESDGVRDSTILFSYDTPIGPDGTPWGGHPTAYKSSSATLGPSASVGMENVGESEGVTALSCTPSCHVDSHFPAQQAITIQKKADLIVAGTTGDSVGWAGVRMQMAADVRNAGAQAAGDFTVRFYGSTDSVLDAADADLGTSSVTQSAAVGATVRFTHEAILPAGIRAGSYYIIARADPDRAVDEDVTANNLGVYGPFPIGEPTPDVVVESVTPPAAVDIGSTFNLAWTARNLGNAPAMEVPYAVVLSDNELISATDRRIGAGTFSVDLLTDAPVNVQVELPSDIQPGSYYVGIVIDPDDVLHEIDDLNNTGASATTFDAFGGPLQVLTTSLPAAQIGASYCVALNASGGNGDYTWTVANGSALPPGLGLLRESSRNTLLCGTPSAIGSYTFAVQVASAGATANGALTLEVTRSTMPLTVVSSELPIAIFSTPYETELLAVGGQAPYSWSLVAGELPLGLRLSSTGTIVGAPQVDGNFAITVQVEDAQENVATEELQLQVTSPSRLSCVTSVLPTLLVGQTLDVELAAAGGTKPYTWTSVEARRLSNGSTDEGQTFVNQPPPGLVLSGSGVVSGAPTGAGSYLWTVEVSDDNRAVDQCIVRLDVVYEQGLTVVTQLLADADVNVPYKARLQAAGGDGLLRWRVAPGSKLPSGLSMDESGLIEGLLGADLLEGETARTFPFVVEVRDSQNRIGIAGLSVTLREAVVEKPVENDGETDDEGGCQAGAAAPGLFGVALALGLVARRRRR